MPEENQLILGEATRTLDERYRLSIPSELVGLLPGEERILVRWRSTHDEAVNLIEAKLRSGRLQAQIEQVQTLGRLLSTRHTEVQLGGRGRLSIPDGFRQFLGAEPGEEVIVVGAAVCIEIWRCSAWLEHLSTNMPQYRELLETLVGK